MKDLHDKLFAEAMAQRLKLFMDNLNDPDLITEYMMNCAKAEHERINVAIKFASVYSEGSHGDAEWYLKSYVDSKRPPKEPFRWPWNKRIRGRKEDT